MKNTVTTPATGTAKTATATTPPRKQAPGTSVPAKHQIPAAALLRVNRLAHQLDMSPGEVLARIIDRGIAEVDHNLMWECDPFGLDGELAEYSPSAELDAMTVPELDALEAGGHTAQRVLYVAHCQKQGTAPDGCYRAD